MPNWYCTREQIKRAIPINGVTADRQIDRIIAAESRSLDRKLRRWFIPRTETRLYRFPTRNQSGAIIWLDADLLSITTLRSEAQNSSPTTIASTDYFLEPNNDPPYNRIEIDLSSSSVFQAGDTPQRSISVAGSWGYDNDTESAGTVSSGLASSASATSMVCSDASKIEVGHTLLIETEQIFVFDRSFAALGSILLDMAGNLAADKATVTVTVDATHGIVAGEVVRINSEQMLVESVATNNLAVQRAYNGTVLAAHTNNDPIHINRTLTIVRGVNGTTAATHADATAISKYLIPEDITDWCIAEVISTYEQERAGYARTIGSGEGEVQVNGRQLSKLRSEGMRLRRNLRSEAI